MSVNSTVKPRHAPSSVVVHSRFAGFSMAVEIRYLGSTKPDDENSRISWSCARTPYMLERSGMCTVRARVWKSMKCACDRSRKKSSTAARTTPSVGPPPTTTGSHSWWMWAPFHERRTQK